MALFSVSVIHEEKINNFLLTGLDVLQVTGITVDYMMKNGASSEKIEKFLLQQSADYTAQMEQNFTGIYGLFNDEYIDGMGTVLVWTVRGWLWLILMRKK